MSPRAAPRVGALTRMRVLFVTNYYPPSDQGWGYMQLCEEVVEGLQARGHDVAVLTSDACQGPEPDRPYAVDRGLRIDPDWQSSWPAIAQFFVRRRARERAALAAFGRLAGRFRPDVVFVWHAIGLPRRLLAAVEAGRAWRTAYYLAGYLPELPDEYLAYWSRPAARPLARLVKGPAARLARRQLAREGPPVTLHYPNTICVSDYVRRRLVGQQLVPADAVVVHNGVDVLQFDRRDGRDAADLAGGLRGVVAGRVTPEKGLHTVVEALGRLGGGAAGPPVTVTVLGSGPPDYLEALHSSARAAGLEWSLRFEPPVPRDAMPETLARFNTLLLPSEYAEPIARSMQEAMALGLLVIGTTTGGSGELLVDGETGLVFEPGDAGSLARAISRATADPARMEQLARAGRDAVRRRFTIERTVDGVERHLARLLEASP